jgi:hypothetical protein
LNESIVSGPESVRRDTRLLLVSNDAMRARRRPLAILAYYVYQLALSALVAWPVARGLGALFAGHPRGDSVLFDDGGWALLALRTAWDRLSPAVSSLLLLVVVGGAVVGLAPLSALLASISHAAPDMRAPRPRHLAPYVVATFRTLLFLLAIGSALELALLAVAMWAFGATRDALQTRSGDARADEIGVLACVLVLFIASVVSVLHDLARASAVRYRGTTIMAVRGALATMRRSPLRVWWSWAWRALASLALFVVVAWTIPRFSSRALSLVAIALLHQLVALARVALRASWLARALRAVDAIKKK